MEIIRSKDNRLVKTVKSLNNKKGREENNLFILEGPKVIVEAMTSNFEIYAVCIREDIYDKANLGHGEFGWIQDELALFEAGKSKYKLFVLQKDIFDLLSLTENSQGVMGLIKMNDSDAAFKRIKSLMKNEFCFIALDEIQDPGNMGTIIRTAEAFGIEGILVGKGSVDIFNDKVIRSTMGSILRMPVCQIDDLKGFLTELREEGVQIVGADPYSENDFRTVSKDKKTILVIGNEARGISDDIKNCLTISVKIPMLGRTESLNASIAAALMAYEFRVNKNS